MANLLILYDSKNGATAKMAELVEEGAMCIQDINVRLRKIDEADEKDIVWCDGLAVGSPTNLGAMSWKMKKFWDDLSNSAWHKIDGKIATVFSSAASYGGGVKWLV